MGHPNENNRSTAITPEIAGQINTDLLAAVKDAFAAGVTAGRVEIILTDAQVEKITDVIRPYIAANFKNYILGN